MGPLSGKGPRFDEDTAAHVRAAEKLARDAKLDIVAVGHVIAALLLRPSWLRDQLDDEADARADEILDRLGTGDGGIPAWSPRLRDAVDRAGEDGAPIDEPRLLAGIATEADGIVAEVLRAAGPLPPIPERLTTDPDDGEEHIPSGGVQVWPPPPKPRPHGKVPALATDDGEEIEVVATSIRIGPPTPALDRYGKDLLALARAGKLRRAFGRDELFRQIVVGLMRQSKPHVLLVGEAGVGKTAIAEGLAVKLANDEVPELAGMRLVALEPAMLMAGATYHGDLEERVRRVIAEAAQSRTLLFIDEIHGLLSSGSRSLSAADALKPALARSDIRVIGATTGAEYDRFIARDAALARRFERIDVLEPDAEATLAILRGLQPGIEKHHGVTITDEALTTAIELTSRYLPARKQPDKSIDVLDEACSRARMDGKPRVEKAEIANAVTQRAGVVLSELGQGDRSSLAGLEQRLAARVIGQSEAISTLSRCIVRSRLGLKPAGKPVGAVLLWGPSGVGKTALATAIAEEAFGGNAFLRIDLAEYSESHQVARLIGSPPGYIGHDEDGVLTGWLRRQPHSVVLLDELDKAHARVRELMLGLFDAGRITDGRGTQISGEHAMFIATGVSGAGDPRTLLGAELVGRLDAIVTMQRLGPPEYRRIAKLLVDDARARLAKAKVTLDVDDAVVDILARAGGKPANEGPDLGARPIRGAVERTLVDPIARIMLDRSVPLSIRAIVRDGKIGLVG